MKFLDSLTQSIQSNPSRATAIALGAVLALVVLFVYLIASVISLKKRYNFLLRHEQTQDLGNVFSEHTQILDKLSGDQSDLGRRVRRVESRLDSTLQRVGVVRFDALDDVGGALSFAVALLDEQGNGVVLSSLYSRNDCRTYAKEISGGKSAHLLSDEEQQALTIARQNPAVLAPAEPVS